MVLAIYFSVNGWYSGVYLKWPWPFVHLSVCPFIQLPQLWFLCINMSGIARLCAFSLLAHLNSKRHIKLSIFCLFHIRGHITLGQYTEKGTSTPGSWAIPDMYKKWPSLYETLLMHSFIMGIPGQISICVMFHRISGLILGLRPTNERRRCFVTTSLIGWAWA